MAQPAGLVNLIETIDNIPPDIQKCLLTIAQYGCRPDQVQRWYTIVRECFGADNPPPPGNLFEHEVVLTPMAPAIGPNPSPRVSMGPSGVPVAAKNRHGLGLRLDPTAHDGMTEMSQTPRAAYAPTSFVSPPSVSSHAESAIDSVAFSPLAVPGPHMTPRSSNGSVGEPDAAAYSFVAPEMSTNPSQLVARYAQMQEIPAMQQASAMPDYNQQMSSTDMELFMRAPIDAPAKKTHVATHSNVSSVSMTSTEWAAPAGIPGPSPEPRLKRRKLLTRELGSSAKQQSARRQHSLSISSNQTHSDRHISPRTSQPPQDRPHYIPYMSSPQPAANAYFVPSPAMMASSAGGPHFPPSATMSMAGPTPPTESFQHFPEVPQPSTSSLYQFPHHPHTMYSTVPPPPPGPATTTTAAHMTAAAPTQFMAMEHHPNVFQYH